MADAAEFRSGRWTGFWQQVGRRYRQDLELTFSAGRVNGSGMDLVGVFDIRGTYDAAAREARWIKTYPRQHSVHYRGYREIKGIWGVWEIEAGERGGFHIWPLEEGAAVTEQEEAAVQHSVTMPAAAPGQG